MRSDHSYRYTKNQFLPALFLVFFSFSFLFSTAEVDKAKWADGKTLFKGNCASCHNPKADGTGPALMGVTARWEAAGEQKGKTGKQWLYTWIRNWKDATGGGYKYAMDMANSRPSEMNMFPTLKDEQIDNILLYVENPDAGGAPVTTAAPAAGEAGKGEAEGPGLAIYLFVAFLLVLVIILVGVTNKLDKIIDEKEGGVVAEAKTPFWKTPRFITALVLIGIVWLGYMMVDSTVSLGRQQGYQPEQPIKFSHELHAGKHKIDCQYCHSTANTGKHSNIPSLNTCMNCHKNVSKGPEYGTEQIAKIYDHVGWDVASKTFSKEQKPIEWVRIHNLPDHVYFNHAQHVNAGKVQCQTCHGPVETMKEVYQYAPLSMGWCINCHRNTDVQFASNNYYTGFEKLHEDLRNHKIDRVTVETIGGTECQKCHY